jgi:superfamily II DNA helicase RecQ
MNIPYPPPNRPHPIAPGPPLSVLEEAELRAVITQGFAESFQRPPYDWQVDAVSHWLRMALWPSRFLPMPVLMVRPTGGGKSATRDVTGLLLGSCVVLTIVPLLSLGADQTLKIKQYENDNNLPVTPIHIDEEKDPRERDRIIQWLLRPPLDTATETVLLFASPQAIVNSVQWQSAIKLLLQRRRLRFIAVDECHLFAKFGNNFCDEFALLRDVLWKHVRESSSRGDYYSKVPLLFMTATGTMQMCQQLETLTGFHFLPDQSFLWPTDSFSFRRRNVFIDVRFSEQTMAVFKSDALPLLKKHDHKKAILFTNFKSRCEGQ